MNSYVIDVNILFSGLISRKPFYAKIFSKYTFYTSDFALLELEKYRNILLKKIPNEQWEIFEQFALKIFSQLTIVPNLLLRNEVKEAAYQLCEPVDTKDYLYVAVAMQLNLTLITRDKPLYEHLKANNFSNMILFDDFLNQKEIF